MRIAAAITTYNRLDSLKRCIAHARAQSRPVDEIIVVDDVSTDGTRDWLAEQDDVVAIHHAENGGCAGSFHTAIREAYERGHDWVWAMDDDVFAHPDALERLLEAAEALRAQGVRLGGLKAFEAQWHRGQPVRLPYALPSTLGQALRDRYMSREVVAEMGRGEPVEIVSFTFCSTLFAREALAACGFPEPDYYYYGEDYDLAFRLRAKGFRNFLVPRAIVEHAGAGLNAPRYLPPAASWRYYYMYRNQWRLIRTYGHLLDRPKRLACELRILAGALVRVARETARGNPRAARMTLMGLRDALLGRRGKRVAPSG